jgi:hypothetical protein
MRQASRKPGTDRAVSDNQTKFQSENVIAVVYLGIAIAGANTLIVMAVAIAFVII